MKKLLATATLVLALCPGAPTLTAQGTSKASASSADGVSVDAIIAALYASVSHPNDGEPNFDRMRAIFLPVGMLIPPKKPQEDLFTVLDVDGFQDRVVKFEATARAKGDPTAFFEKEVARKTDCFGNICQIFSTYESRRAPSDEKPFVRGINSIQLVRDGEPATEGKPPTGGNAGRRAGGNRWWIASVIWDTERPDNPIPAPVTTPESGVPKEYLKKN